MGKSTLTIFLFVVFIVGCSNKEKLEGFNQSFTINALPLNVKSPKDNPSTKEKVELGKLLFFDPILSGHKDVSCATCHHPEFGFAESLEISIGMLPFFDTHTGICRSTYYLLGYDVAILNLLRHHFHKYK